MKNKGFSIIECVICLSLLSVVTAGIFSVTINIKEQNMTRMYENAMYTNYHTIFRACDLSNDPKSKLIELYDELITEINQDSLVIKIDLSVPYYQCDNIQYKVTFEETEKNKIVCVEILNLNYRYKGVNDENLSKRVYPK